MAGGDPNCQETDADECLNDLNGDWNFEAAECVGFTCPNSAGPPNDECVDATVVTDGSIAWNNLISLADCW